MSLLPFFLGFAMQSLNVSREAPRPGWEGWKSLLPLHVSPFFFGWVQILRTTPFPFSIIFPCFLLGGNLLGETHLRCVCKQHPNLTSTSSKVDWSWSSGAQVLPKTSAVESRRPTAWKDGWFLFFDLNTWMHNSSSHILAPSSQQAPKVNGPKYPWQLFLAILNRQFHLQFGWESRFLIWAYHTQCQGPCQHLEWRSTRDHTRTMTRSWIYDLCLTSKFSSVLESNKQNFNHNVLLENGDDWRLS